MENPMRIEVLIESNVLEQQELEGDRSAQARERRADLRREFEELTRTFERQERKRRKRDDEDWDL